MNLAEAVARMQPSWRRWCRRGRLAAAHLEPEMIKHIHQKAMVGGSEKANLLPYQVFLVFREES